MSRRIILLALLSLFAGSMVSRAGVAEATIISSPDDIVREEETVSIADQPALLGPIDYIRGVFAYAKYRVRYSDIGQVILGVFHEEAAAVTVGPGGTFLCGPNCGSTITVDVSAAADDSFVIVAVGADLDLSGTGYPSTSTLGWLRAARIARNGDAAVFYWNGKGSPPNPVLTWAWNNDRLGGVWQSYDNVANASFSIYEISGNATIDGPSHTAAGSSVNADSGMWVVATGTRDDGGAIVPSGWTNRRDFDHWGRGAMIQDRPGTDAATEDPPVMSRGSAGNTLQATVTFALRGASLCAEPDVSLCFEPSSSQNPPGYTQERCIPVDPTCDSGTCFGVCADEDGVPLVDIGSLAGINDDPNPIATLTALDPYGGDYCAYSITDRCTNQGGACSFTLECETHRACNAGTKQCELRAGRQLSSGEVGCETNADCVSTHTTCRGLQCVIVPEPGADECLDNNDCLEGLFCPLGVVSDFIEQCTPRLVTQRECLSGAVAQREEPFTFQTSIVWGHVDGPRDDISLRFFDGSLSIVSPTGEGSASLDTTVRFDGGQDAITSSSNPVSWISRITTDADGVNVTVRGMRDDVVTLDTPQGGWNMTIADLMAFNGTLVVPADATREIVTTVHVPITRIGPQCALLLCTAAEIAAGICSDTCSTDTDCEVVDDSQTPPKLIECAAHRHPNPPYGDGGRGTLENDGFFGNDSPALVTEFQTEINQLNDAGVGFTLSCTPSASCDCGVNLCIDGLYGSRTERAARDYQAWRASTTPGECGPVDGIVGPLTWTCLAQDVAGCAETTCGDGICGAGEYKICPVDCALRRSPLPSFPRNTGTPVPLATCSDTDRDGFFDACSETGETIVFCDNDGDCTGRVFTTKLYAALDGSTISTCSVPLGSGNLDNESCTASPTNTCGGTYAPLSAQNPAAENFGDASCSFSEAALFRELKRLDCRYANFWMDIAAGESGFNPNVSISGSSWGLFQTGRGIGDTPWLIQVSNALSLNNTGDQWCDWGTARSLIPGLDSMCVSGDSHEIGPDPTTWPSAC